MKRLLVFLAVALMLLVASCGDGNTVSGYVVVKRHNPVRHYTTRDEFIAKMRRIRDVLNDFITHLETDND